MKNTLIKTISAVFLLTSLATMQSCGKNTDLQDDEAQQLQENVEKKEETYAPLAGRYVGTLTSIGREGREAEVKKVSLVLIPMIIIIQNPGRNDVSEIPTLGGNLNILIASNIEGEPDEVLPIAQFSTATFNPTTSRLRLSGGYQTGSSIGNLLSTLDGIVDGTKITAHVSNSTRGSLGLLEVEKSTD